MGAGLGRYVHGGEAKWRRGLMRLPLAALMAVRAAVL